MRRLIDLLVLFAVLAAIVSSFAYLSLDLWALVGEGGAGKMGSTRRVSSLLIPVASTCRPLREVRWKHWPFRV